MNKNQLILARYYLKNLALMRGYGSLYGLFLERSRARWEALYEAVKGHDTWLVVGNGPSLKVEDLEAFKDIPSVASNKINLLYGKTDWRPTLHTIADPLLLFKLPASHYENIELQLLPHTHVLMARTPRKLTWRHLRDDEGIAKYLQLGETISPMNGFFVGGTITVANLQLAIWAGAKTIYVIGCDHFYSNESSKDTSKKSAHQGASNHFDPNYRKPGEIVNEAPVDVMNRSYAAMRAIADMRGVKIINITRTTALDTFEIGTVADALADIAAKKAVSAGAAAT